MKLRRPQLGNKDGFDSILLWQNVSASLNNLAFKNSIYAMLGFLN